MQTFRGAFGGSVWCGSKRLRLWLQSKRELKKRLMKAVFRLPKKSQILNFNFAIIFYLTPFFCQIFFIFGFSSGFVVYLHIDMQVNKKPPAVRLKSRRSAPVGRYLSKTLLWQPSHSLPSLSRFVQSFRLRFLVSFSRFAFVFSFRSVVSLSFSRSFSRLTAPSLTRKLGSTPSLTRKLGSTPSLTRKLGNSFESYQSSVFELVILNKNLSHVTRHP